MSEETAEEVVEEVVEPVVEPVVETNSYLTAVEGIQDEKVREFASRFTSFEDSAKSGLELRQKLSGSITLPGENASEEDVAKYHKAIGVPETTDAYEISVPEGTEADEAFHGAIKEAAHKAGVSQKQLAALNEAYNGYAMGAIAAQETAMTGSIEAKSAALKKEWGDDYDTNVAVSQRALRTFADPEFISWMEEGTIDGVPPGDHPFMAKMLANVGRRLGEDTLADGRVGEEEAADLEAEHERITGQIVAASDRGDRMEAQRLQKMRDGVNSKLAGRR